LNGFWVIWRVVLGGWIVPFVSGRGEFGRARQFKISGDLDRSSTDDHHFCAMNPQEHDHLTTELLEHVRPLEEEVLKLPTGFFGSVLDDGDDWSS
jgi:hypothetical protein